MEIKVYFIDAFTNVPFKGNSSAVVYLNNEVDVKIMQNIAMEFNLSETAFIYPISDSKTVNKFGIRWFTPKMEMPLCGHATLAASKVIFDEYLINGDTITYESRSGVLQAVRNGNYIKLDFPIDDYIQYHCSTNILHAIGLCDYKNIVKGVNTSKLIIHLDTEKEVIQTTPNFHKMLEESVDFKGVAITAKGSGDYDFVSRYFNPWAGVNEDSVTGSVHTVLATYWRDILKRNTLNAYQASTRGGYIGISIMNNGRVSLSGEAIIVVRGSMTI